MYPFIFKNGVGTININCESSCNISYIRFILDKPDIELINMQIEVGTYGYFNVYHYTDIKNLQPIMTNKISMNLHDDKYYLDIPLLDELIGNVYVTTFIYIEIEHLVFSEPIVPETYVITNNNVDYISMVGRMTTQEVKVSTTYNNYWIKDKNKAVIISKDALLSFDMDESVINVTRCNNCIIYDFDVKYKDKITFKTDIETTAIIYLFACHMHHQSFINYMKFINK